MLIRRSSSGSLQSVSSVIRFAGYWGSVGSGQGFDEVRAGLLF